MAPRRFGNWQLERILGSGGFGQVELWKENGTNKRIAIKKCTLPKNTVTPRQMERWKQEIENMKNFTHPNIVKAEQLPAEIVFGSSVLCMEYCNKGDLRKVLRKPGNSCGLLQNDVLSIMKDISSALKYLHYKTITHRDIKPENIVIQEKHGLVIYKLIDLGYAKELGSATASASLVGTFSYVAPELFWKGKYTCSVDYWSLGIVFFEILTGYKPFAPYRDNLADWIKSMQHKKYDEICAKEVVGGIEFYNGIIYSNDLSENTLNRIVKWFRVALQWDPRQRGKYPDSDEIVIFSLLKEIFPSQSIYVFFVSLYRIDRYDVNCNTTLMQLQEWVEKKSSIPIDEQVITDNTGNLLQNALLPEKIADSILYVYRRNHLEVNLDDTDSKMPEIVDLMLTDENAISDRSTLRQCYTAIIYMMKHEIMLFENYTFALGVKLDMITGELNVLNGRIQKILANAESLLNEVNTVYTKAGLPNTAVEDSMDNLLSKVKALVTTISGIKCEIEQIQQTRQKIKEFFDRGELLHDLEIYTELHENFLKTFLTFDNGRSYSTSYINDQVNELTEALSEFDSQKDKQLKRRETTTVISQLVLIEERLCTRKYLEVINSAVELVQIYKSKFSKLLDEINQGTNVIPNYMEMPNDNKPSMSLSLVNNDDTEIRDNIVLRALMDKFFRDSKQNLSKIMLIEP